ncbi:MAG: succinate dehydrogenase/fumarate reductase flavoprotein subunit, partial [Candidatus Rokuibacteriota bacterium]
GVVVKGLFGRAGCTRMVQGGYNAVLTPPDSLEAHLTDTLDGGGWINDQEMVWRLVTEAPGRVLELESRYGCLFDRNAEGHIHQKPFAGQTHDRTVHKGDLTGIEIMNRLTEQAQARPSIRAFEECRAVELLRDDAGRAAGALILDVRTGRFFAVNARATLLAMGGGPTMYRVIACSADKAADGIALAYRAGLALRDMEMIQFHPTGLVIPGSLMTGALLEEGLRGAGGQLRNGLGERFMARYDAARMERSTRDLVSRASFLEVSEGRGTPNGGIWIDVSHLGADVVERNFRGMVRRCRDFGRDLARGPVEVGPTAHFMMGGVVVDPDCRTAMEGLFAPLGRAGGAEVYAIQRELRDLMWERAGLVRDAEGLGVAAVTLQRLTERLEVVGVPGHGSLNTAWQDWLNLDSQLTAAQLVVASALARRESRGAHWRRDFPAPAATAPVSIRVQRRDGAPVVWEEPVAMTRARPRTGAPRPVAVEIGD